MEKVFVKSGIVQGDLSSKIYELYDFSFVRRCLGIRFRQIIPISREIRSVHCIDSYNTVTNETFSEVGHETHNMR